MMNLKLIFKAFVATILDFIIIFLSMIMAVISLFCFIWFMGHDDKLRMLSLIKNDWTENQLPLTAGITALRSIIKNLNVSNYTVVNHRNIKLPYNCNIVKTWATIWPPTNDLILDMLLTHQLLTKKILTDLKILKDKKWQEIT